MIAATLSILLIGGVVGVNWVRSESYLNSLLKVASEAEHSFDPVQEPARKQRAWRLYKLWLVHDKRDIVPQVAPFLQDEHWLLRQNAARILGRIESAKAESLLQETLTAVEQGRATTPINPEALQLALARSRSRGLKGQAKLAAFAKGMGLSFNEAIRLTEKVHAAWAKANGSVGQKLVKEMVDMLYVMGKRGEDIKPLVERLNLHPAQQVLLQGATLPPDQEAKLIVDYLTQLNVGTPDDLELAQFYLVSLKPQATEMIMQRLQEIKDGRVQYGRRGYAALFLAAALIRDARVVPLLKHFAKSPDRPMSHYANMALEHFEFMGQWSSPRCPWPPLLLMS